MKIEIIIFLNVFNVHVNRIPLTSRVKKVIYKKGNFIAAYDHKASDENERKGLPEAVIYSEEKCLILESKISSRLARDQLIRHERTVSRRGFNDIRIIGVVVDLMPNVRLDKLKQITWNEVYNWTYKETKKSEWSKKLIEYFNVAENKMVEDEYLTEGSITEFTGCLLYTSPSPRD